MRAIWLATFCLSSAVLAQDPPAKQDPPVKKAAPNAEKGAPAGKTAPTAEKASAGGRKLAPPVADAPPLDLAAATKAAVAAMIALQEGDESDQWPYQGVYREDSSPSPVGYRVGGTAIACLALAAVPGLAADHERHEALERGLAFVLKTLDAPRMSGQFIGTYDVRGWGHIYALQLFLHLQDQKLVPASLADAVAEKTKWLVATLCESAIPKGGGWNYSRPAGYLDPKNRASTFMTPAALQALFHAKARGFAVDDKVVTEALDALERARAKPGGYSYGSPANSMAEVGEDKLTMMDKTPSSAARAAACETTLLLAGRGDKKRLEAAVELFFAHWDDLAVRKSQEGTHIMPYGIAPYYFMFGHVYCAQAIEQLDDPDLRERLRAKMRAVLAKSREENGVWNDRQFGRSGGYGTAMALLALHMQRVPKPVAWTPSPAPK